ncbi:hypothetical protein BpHYR1_000878 [Brachionus plicatilis]|uniref:T-complex 1 subunit alpha n=1 Tax=Brachionus plicatilis TaxID=10195 RepID=A0A3M7S792_BRAPC|nr:hypothetical protein BpHYR1_000878 [Brachionus plicatilis]
MLSDDIVVNFIITNDVNTFLKLPEVEHPAAKILVNLNKFHDLKLTCDSQVGRGINNNNNI